MNPLVSIIIPNFNKAVYIAKTFDSLISQIYENWEAVVVDDGSTDKSLKIIEEYSKKDNRFRLIKRYREPKGGSVCRNIGLENALGNYVIYLDSDDLFIKSTLENRIKAFLKYPNNDFLVFPMGTFKKHIGDNKSTWIAKKDNHLKCFLLHKLQWTVTSPIWKKTFLLQLNGFDELFPRLQDVEFHTRALMVKDVSYKVFTDIEPDSYYRIDEERIVDDYPQFMKKWLNGVLIYIKKMSELIKNNDQLESKKHLFYLKGTVISMLNQLLYNQKQGNISTEQCNKLLDELLYNKNIQEILSKLDYTLIRVYHKLYMFGLYKIKGFNYLFRKMIVRV